MTDKGLADIIALITTACRNAPEFSRPGVVDVWRHKLRGLSDEDARAAADALTDDDSWTPYPADILRKAAERAAVCAARNRAQRRALPRCGRCSGDGVIDGTQTVNGRTTPCVYPCPNGCPKPTSTAGDIAYASAHSVVPHQPRGLAPMGLPLRALRRGISE